MMENQEHMPILEPEEISQKRPTQFMRYLTVSGLYLSFLTCLLALLLNWLIPTHMMVWMPDWLISVVENNRIATLLVPLSLLFVCYWEVRDMTGDILARPERYLDERQQMLRDQVHRSAYKILKCACLAVPVLILVGSLLLSRAVPAPTQPSTYLLKAHPIAHEMRVSAPQLLLRVGQQIPIAHRPVHPDIKQVAFIVIEPDSEGVIWQGTNAIPQQATWLNDPTNMGLFFSTFLLSLFMVVSALPMTLLAWRKM